MSKVEHSARGLPSVDRLLGAAPVASLLTTVPRAVVLEATRECLSQARAAVLAGDSAPSLDALAALIVRRVEEAEVPLLRHIVNATGVIIHTNLGRAPLSEDALSLMTRTVGAAGEPVQ